MPARSFAIGGFLFVVCIASSSIATSASADPQTVTAGQVRATPNRTPGTPLKEEARVGAKVVATLSYGTKVTVDRVEGRWVHVTVADGAVAGRSGWMLASQTVEPALLGPSSQVRALASAGAAGVSSQDISAAGRGLQDPRLDARTEDDYRNAHPDLASAFPVVDRIVAANRAVDPAAIETFIEEGRLGRPGK